MNLLPTAAALLLAAVSTPAAASINLGRASCGIDTPYSVRIEPERIVFTHDRNKQVVALRADGAVEVDGFTAPMDARDRALIRDMEREMRNLIPVVKGIAIDAVAIAFEAVGHASMAFAESPQHARESAERIARTADEIKRAVETQDSWGSESEAHIERIVEGAVGTLIGELVGNVTAQAIKVAFSGDGSAIAELEARAGSIEKNVDKAIKARGRELEARAEEFCERLRGLEDIEARISARLPDGSQLDLIRLRR